MSLHFLQSNNPHGGMINQLGVYLLISLSFVIAAMVEFAGIMFLQRKNRLIRSNKVTNNGELIRRGSFEMELLTMKIDSMALLIFSSAYVLFNSVYWAANLTAL